MSSTKFALYLRDTLSMALILFGIPLTVWVWAVAFGLAQ